MLGDLNGWVINMLKAGISTGFGIVVENDNGKRVIDFCVGRELCG